MDRYEKTIDKWNDIFANESSNFPTKKESGNESFDKGLAWLTKDAHTILDFGCGNGIVLFLCSKYGTNKHIGIDLSVQAIDNAKNRSKKSSFGEFIFKCGGVDLLKEIETASIDGVVLSNIIDNLYPDDAMTVLNEVKRILAKDGKLLVKLNPYLSDEEIDKFGIKVIYDNLLDDGMLLWNNSTAEWTNIFSSKFVIEHYEEFYYEEYEQYNRMYFLINK